jgi:hypothetical protein
MAVDTIIAKFELQTAQAQAALAEMNKRLDATEAELKQVASQSTKTGQAIQKSAKDSGGGFMKLKDQLMSLGATMGVVFGAQEVARFAYDAIQSASDMGETLSKVGVIFGDTAGDIEAWADTAADRLGQTKQQALDAASTFAIFGKSAGLSGSDLSGFSVQMTELASDLASFNNTSPEEAIQAIGSALRGEAEPIRAYGVLLDDASLRQEALSQGLIKTTKEALTPQQKVLAAQGAILKQTTLAQGDFARTMDSTSNVQKRLTASIGEVQRELGEALLPAFHEVISGAKDFVTAVDFSHIFQKIGEVMRVTLDPLMAWGRSVGYLFSALFKGAKQGDGINNFFAVLKGLAKGVAAPMVALLKISKALIDNWLIPMVETGRDVIAWFNEVREGGGFVGKAFDLIADAVAALFKPLQMLGNWLFDFSSGGVDIVAGLREELGKLGDEDQIKQLEKYRKHFEGNMQAVKAIDEEIAKVRGRLAKKEQQQAQETAAAVSEAAKKAAADRLKALEQAEAEIRKINAELLSEALSQQERERMAVELKYKDQLAEARQFANDSTAEGRRWAAVEASLQEAVNMELLAINDKYRKLEELKAQEQRQLQLESDQEIEAQRLADRQEYLDSKLSAEDLAYKTEAEKLKERVTNGVITWTEYYADLEELDKKYKDAAQAREDAANQAAEQAIQDRQAALLQTTQLFGETLTNIMQITAGNSKAFADFQKFVGLAELAVSKAVAIANAVRVISSTSVTAIDLIANIAAVTAAITSVFAGVFSAINQSQTPEVPEFESYATGTAYLERNGAPKGIDTIPVMANEGEAIIPTGANAAAPGLAKAWIDGNLDDYIFRNYVIPALEEQAAEAAAKRMEAMSLSQAHVAGFDDFRLYVQSKKQVGYLEQIATNTKRAGQTRKRFYS